MREELVLEYALDRFEREVRDSLENQARIPPEFINLVTPGSGIQADLAFPTFRLARSQNVAPPLVAQELASIVRFEPTSL